MHQFDTMDKTCRLISQCTKRNNNNKKLNKNAHENLKYRWS